MPILTWFGKDKIQNHRVPFHFLNKISAGNSQNMIIHADNLLALKALLPRFQNQIKCIYIDPPYNTGNESWIYNDNVNAPEFQSWLGSVVGKEGEDLSRHDKWLCMMFPRLSLLRELLADDGAIFISIDDNEQANLRLICDEIFGAQNFVANFVCKSKQGKVGTSSIISSEHEYIVCYAKNFARLKLKMIVKQSDGRKENLRQWGQADKREDRPTMFYPIEIDGKKVFPLKEDGTEGRWRVSEKKAQELLKNNELELVDKNGFLNIYRKFSAGETSMPHGTWIENIATTAKGSITLKNLGLNFAYPKPVELLEFIIDLITDKNSIVLDSFAGSGTTAHAVLNLNKADGGARRFILIELMDYAESITAERVRRVGGDFEYYELGERLLDEAGNLNAAVPVEKLREYIWYSATQEEIPAASEEKYLLDVKGDTAYYFYYEPGEKLALDLEFVRGLKTKARKYEIYAAACQLSGRQMFDFNITFHKVPRELQGL